MAFAIAIFLGAATVAFFPMHLAVGMLILSFLFIIFICWALVTENRAYTFEPWHYLFFGPLKATAEIKSSKRLKVLWVVVAYIAGILGGIAWVVKA